MKDISELSNCFNDFITDLNEGLLRAHNETSKEMLELTKELVEIPDEARNPGQFIVYQESIQEKTEQTGDEIKSSVYSDLVVNDGSKWDGVPIGAFLEWGTGPLGESTNEYKHGYPYTTQEPWDFHTLIQEWQTGTWGIRARPHFVPAFMMTMPRFAGNIKKAVREAWMR